MKNLFILPLLVGGLNTQPNRANNTNFSISSAINLISTSENEIEDANYTEDYYYNISANQTLMNITGKVNCQEERLFSDDELVIRTNNRTTHYTSIFYWLEIDSTKYIENANLSLNLYLNITTRDQTHSIVLNYTTWYSTTTQMQTYWQSVEDQVEDPEFNYTQITNLLNNQWGYQNTTTNGIKYAQEQTLQNITLTQTLLQGKNYIAVYIEPTIRVNTYTPEYYLYDTITSNRPWANIVDYSDTIKLNGTYDNTQYNYEVVDIPGMMFEILTMPFTFISMAFNLTLFPGTPYTLDVSNLFLTIIGILIFVWILKKLVFKS